jgi:hypothetical protein
VVKVFSVNCRKKSLQNLREIAAQIAAQIAAKIAQIPLY